MINTCPCMRPQKAVMVFAIVDAVLSLLGLGLLILALVAVFKLDDDSEFEVSSRTVVIIGAVVGAVITLLQLILAFTLYNGAKNNAYRVVRIWFIITIVIFVINIITLIMNIVGGANAGTALGGSIVNIVYKVYELLVVRHFMEVLQTNPSGGNTFMPTAYPQAQTTTVYATPNPQQAYPVQSYPGAAPPSSTAPYPGSQEPQVGFTYTQPTTVRNELYTGPQTSTFDAGV